MSEFQVLNDAMIKMYKVKVNWHWTSMKQKLSARCLNLFKYFKLKFRVNFEY